MPGILEARDSESKEETSARWLVIGLKVETSDLVKATPDGDLARTWLELEEHLESRCAAEGGELRFYMSAAEHMGDLLHLSSQSGQHGGVDQFRRAFANAVSFETIEDESQVVRTYVLDRDNISIRGLRESMRNYREIAETIQLKWQRHGQYLEWIRLADLSALYAFLGRNPPGAGELSPLAAAILDLACPTSGEERTGWIEISTALDGDWPMPMAGALVAELTLM